ncbi:MAG: hypothetical protein HKO07_03180, partial [Pseudomonadales bacterium]|nr:hypothetical protein [Pseudomonadales bacterium]
DDAAAVEQQFKQIERDVLALKDHPALLMWGIGNELNLHYKNHKVWSAVNDIALMIKQHDPNHPTTTMLAGAEKDDIQQVVKHCPDLDILSLQLYGEIENIEDYINDSGYDGAYLITEWGVTGHWEVPLTAWKQPLEQSSLEKGQLYKQRYENYILNGPGNCLGSFVFLWGQKQERTPTWYGIFTKDGSKTAVVDAMQYVWTGTWPEHRAPAITSLQLDQRAATDNIQLQPGRRYSAQSQIQMCGARNLAYQWVIMREVDRALRSEGGDFEAEPETVAEFNGAATGQDIEFTAPGPGEYRLYCYAYDVEAGTATANIPFRVK